MKDYLNDLRSQNKRIQKNAEHCKHQAETFMALNLRWHCWLLQ